MPGTMTIDEERATCARLYAWRYALRADALEAWMCRHNQRAYELELAVRERGSQALVIALLNDRPLHEEESQ